MTKPGAGPPTTTTSLRSAPTKSAHGGRSTAADVIAPPPTLDARGVSKTFTDGAHRILACDQVDLAVRPGEFVLVQGPSGSGKSTLLMACAGLVRPDDGAIHVAGLDLVGADDSTRARTRLEHIGVVFQAHLLVGEFCALDNVRLPLDARGWSARDAEEEARRWLTRVGLGEQTGRRPDELSGGQRQRVGIARALAGRRRLVIADEPTGSLDSAMSRDIFVLLRELADAGIAVLVASHDPHVVDLPDRLITMSDGRVDHPTARSTVD